MLKKSKSERISEKVELPPDHNKTIGVYNQESATNMEIYLIEAITNPSPTSPFASIRASKFQAIRKLAYILKQKTTPQ